MKLPYIHLTDAKDQERLFCELRPLGYYMFSRHFTAQTDYQQYRDKLPGHPYITIYSHNDSCLNCLKSEDEVRTHTRMNSIAQFVSYARRIKRGDV